MAYLWSSGIRVLIPAKELAIVFISTWRTERSLSSMKSQRIKPQQQSYNIFVVSYKISFSSYFQYFSCSLSIELYIILFLLDRLIIVTITSELISFYTRKNIIAKLISKYIHCFPSCGKQSTVPVKSTLPVGFDNRSIQRLEVSVTTQSNIAMNTLAKDAKVIPGIVFKK